MKVLDKGVGSIILGLEDNKIVVSYFLFRIDFVLGEESVVSINV